MTSRTYFCNAHIAFGPVASYANKLNIINQKKNNIWTACIDSKKSPDI